MKLSAETLEQLENDYWGNPPANSSSLIRASYELRKKSIRDFEVEDLRIMIGQNIGLAYLIPIAINILKQNPFVESIYYEGDLLKNVLTCDSKFWSNHPDFKDDMLKILTESHYKIDGLGLTDETKNTLRSTVVDFMNHYSTEKFS